MLEIKPFPERKDAGTVAYWTKDEVVAILNTVKPHWRDAFEFLYNTGLRKDELIHLTWRDVVTDGPNPCIIVQAKENWTPKTSQRRIIPLNPRVVAILRRQTTAEAHPYVFKGEMGGLVHRDRIYTALKRALKQLGMEGDVHKFRHTFASHLVM